MNERTKNIRAKEENIGEENDIYGEKDREYY
jgi:hypothetical protein